MSDAYITAETGDREAAHRVCEELLERPGLSRETRGLIWSQLALIQQREGDRDGALASFSTAVELLQDSPDDLGRALLNRGTLHLDQGAAEAAVADLTHALEYVDHTEGPERAARAKHNLGYARLLNGDLVGALQMMEEGRLVLAPLSAVYRAICAQDRAEVLTAAGRASEAAAALADAATAYGSRRLRTFQAECEVTLARTLLREDPPRARRVALRAARRFRSAGSPLSALRADAIVLVAEIAAGGRGPSLLHRADAIASELLVNGLDREGSILQLQACRVTLRRSNLPETERRLGSVLVDEHSPIEVRLLWREVRAALAEARQRLDLAREEVREGLADLHAWQSSFGSLDLQSTLVGHGSGLALHGLRLALAEHSPELAYEWSERARALVSRVTPVRPPADRQLAAELTELRVLHAADPDPGTEQSARLSELRDRIREQSWYGDGGGQVGEPAALAEVQAELAATDACLVAHVSVEGELTAVVVTGTQAHVVPLGASAPVRAELDRVAADLDMAASQLAGPFAAAIRGSLEERLGLVADVLVRPVLALIGDHRVVLTPAGLLAGTPWTLLPGLAGRPLTVPPSATRWLELRRAARQPDRRRVGLVAGPNVERAEEEVRRAAAAWASATVLTGTEAVADRVAALAAEVDVLHLAGHGHHTGDNPLFSAVELGDGPWFGYDIDQLPHTPGTVVLSSCELGAASVRSGEEVVGMTAAWLHAGARHVISSPALVADDVACEVLAGWHQRVAGGSAPADALAEAASSLGADAAPSPFVSFGAGW